MWCYFQHEAIVFVHQNNIIQNKKKYLRKINKYIRYVAAKILNCLGPNSWIVSNSTRLSVVKHGSIQIARELINRTSEMMKHLLDGQNLCQILVIPFSSFRTIQFLCRYWLQQDSSMLTSGICYATCVYYC
jgi:hypothetical protein